MKLSETDLEQLNAYHDGELDAARTRAMTRRLESEPALGEATPGATWQFERLGYFCLDPRGGWNRTVTLKDTWAKIEGKRA